MRIAVPIVVGLVFVAGCGGEHEPDHTAMFIDCLEQRGGERIEAGAQLDGYARAGVRDGVGASLPSVSYFTVDAATGHGARRRALVFVDAPRDEPLSTPMPPAAEWLRRARAGQTGMRALVLMPPRRYVEEPIDACEALAAPGQAFP